MRVSFSVKKKGLSRDVKNKRKSFYRYYKQGEDNERCCRLQKETGDLVTVQTYRERAEVLNSFCASDSKYSSHVTQVEKGKSRDWENEDSKPSVGRDQVQGDLRNLNVHKSRGTSKIHVWVLRELANEAVKTLSIIF